MKKFLSASISFSLAALLAAQSVIAAPTAITNTQTAEETIIEESVNENIYEEKTYTGDLTGVVANVSIQTAEETVTDIVKLPVYDTQLMALLEGDGTEQNPYLISNAAGLYFFANNINSGFDNDKHYKLTQDIDLGGEEWTPVGYYVPNSSDAEAGYEYSFRGVFDGAGHTISNFKITNADNPYVGFFGFANNATIKNLNINKANVNVTSTTKNALYAAILVGRVTTRHENSKAVVRNCNITNSTLTANGKTDLFAGAVCGIAVATNAQNTEIEISLVNAECKITAATNPDNKKAQYDNYYASAGGIIGYYGSQDKSKIILRNANFDGIISVDNSNTEYASSFGGGIAGGIFVREKTQNNIVYGGTLHLDACSSKGTVVAKARNCESYVGGITGYIDTTTKTYLNDCYSSMDCSGDSLYSYICVGGLFGFVVFDKYSSSYPRTFTNCYAAGDVIDIYALGGRVPPKGSSYVGNVFGYTEADIFNNTYKFSSQTVMGSDIFNDLLVSLDDTAARQASSYAGFDFKYIWEINPSASYPYPTLREKIAYATFINQNKQVSYTSIGASGRVIVPDTIPEKLPTNEYTYTFSHWSTEVDGDAFDFENTPVFEDTTFHAVFREEPRIYTVNYYVDNEKFIPESAYAYGTPLSCTTLIPEKAETAKIAYVFSHWSEIANGEKFDSTGFVCNRDYTFYAVFTEIDKTAWDGEIATGFSGGNGTSALPYIIKSSEELALLAKSVNEGNTEYSKAHYKLEDNINLGNNYWTAIGNASTPFSGVLDGNGYTIRNYKLVNSDYCGLFGYVLNGTIKNLVLSNYDISFSYTTSTSNVYIGAVAGFIGANSNKNASISNVTVSSNNFDVDVTINSSSDTPTLYVGGIAGCVSAVSGYKATVESCYTRTPIKAKSSRYLQLGGIAGHLWSGSGSSCALVTMCYSTSDLSGHAVNNSCKVGGLVGTISAQGKWTPDVEATGDLLAEAKTCMISNSFSVANLSVHSEKYLQYSRVGRIVAESNENACCDEDTTRFLSRSSNLVTVTPFDREETNNQGAGAGIEDLKSKDYLIQHIGFDFENIWIEDGSGFPILKITTSDKPVFDFTNLVYESSKLICSVEFLSNYSEESTLVFVVKNARNQVIKLARIDVENAGFVKEKTVIFENLYGADSISVSAIDKQSLVPLFAELCSNL